MVDKNIFSKLPFDIIKYILLYNNYYILRNNKIIFINKISKEDNRYKILSKKPFIRKLRNNSWGVYLDNINKKYIVEYSYKFGVWKYNFYIYLIDKLIRIINYYPENTISYVLK
jgi:hypothetical protein